MNPWNLWWRQANEREDMEELIRSSRSQEFNEHYNHGRGSFTTDQGIYELVNRRTYNHVTKKQDKYELGYGLGDDDDDENIISSLSVVSSQRINCRQS